MERYIKFVVGAVLVVIVALIMWSVYAKEVGATNYPQHKVTICHKGETIEVDRHAARAHLRLHDEDYEGACKEEPKDYCEYVEGVQGEDEDCPKPEPTCEELQNCEPEVPPVVPPVVEEPKKESSSVRYSQGPNGEKGDHYCQLEYHKIKGSKKVEVRYSEDRVFGNGYKSFTTEDDGAIDLELDGDSAAVKIRGRDSKTEWSDTKLVRC